MCIRDSRRAIIEDAAGISRYKAKRRQAERRLAATEQNLLRVQDITEELKKRLGSLERQAKKAERYKDLRKELRGLDLHFASHRFLELSTLKRHVRTTLTEVENEVQTSQDAIDTQETALLAKTSELESDKTKLHAREAELHKQEPVSYTHLTLPTTPYV